MEMTGHGLRCVPCSNKASLDVLQGKSRMGDHLTPAELDDVIVRCKHEILSGGGTLILGLCGFLLHTVVGFVLLMSGIGLIAHGLSTRNQAIAAKKSFPSAQVVND